MTRLARVLFGILVVATVAAFFVAQRLKSTPAAVQDLGVVPLLSPNQDGRFERTRLSFRLKEADSVDVTIVDDEGDAVRRLLDDRPVRRRGVVRVAWDGRDDAGRRTPDGVYRVRLVLHRQGRSIALPRTIVQDTTPPQPRVLSIGPAPGAGPELLPRPDGAPARIRFHAPGRRPEIEVWRMDGRPRRVTGVEPGELRDGVGTAEWNGTRLGRRVSPGTYAIVVYSRDRAGNRGSSVPEAALLGRPRRGEALRSPGGVTVRYLGVQAPVEPVSAGRQIEVAVDARTEPWRWSLRRAGAPDPVRRGRRTRGGPFRVKAPAGESGLFLFEVRTRLRFARVPVAVDGRRERRVLIVLPATTWQGRNSVDDEGDGVPNTLEDGMPVRLQRVYAGDGLPEGVAENEAPLLASLDRAGRRYDVTTDVALAAGRGPELEGHRGVLLAGDAVWLTAEVRRRLRAFAAAGGTVASLGTGSLRAEVRQTADRLLDPTPPEPRDLFGARIEPVRRRTVPLTILEDDPSLQLFAGEEGLFPRVRAWEATASVGPEARLLASAVTPGGAPVIVAARFGRGLALRTGVPDFATRLSTDAASAELLGRIWTLLRTG